MRFRATHHYRRADWSPAANRAAFGAVADPHPHEYVVTVTVQGPVDRHGFVVDLATLDQSLSEVVAALDGSDLNGAIPELADGVLQPSTEALARWLWERLEGRVAAPARLVRVRVAEGPDLAGQYPA